MPYVEQIMKKNFIEYASYVIKERSIPHLDDGCKPVQRRILHTLLSMDDGKFHKVANVVGACTKYHPHGDAPIYEALVTLANKDLFIDKQGNFGNIQTGDPSSAARYIECRINTLGKELLYNPEITQHIDSYDGRNKEPVTFPAKLPLVLITGAEGIAVVMATSILPHNFAEVLQALIASLNDEPFSLYPDFPNGGLVDVSEYNDGKGKVRTRATLDTSNPKQIMITELPYGVTTEKMITSIEQASRNGKINIAGISDFTTNAVEIVIQLPRGVYAKDILKSLYAFTDCECSVSVNPIVITNEGPESMSNTQIIEYYKARIQNILKEELEVDKKKVIDKIHARTLERIFIEEHIYKKIETCKTAETITTTVLEGLQVFKKEIPRNITDEDIERLLKIPIRRISAYDIKKHQKELAELIILLKKIRHNIAHIFDYTMGYVSGLLQTYGEHFPRKTSITSFETVHERDVAQRDRAFLYDNKTGYMGYGFSEGKKIADVSSFDKILLFKKNGTWMAMNVEEKHFIGKDVLLIGLFDKEKFEHLEFTVVYTTTIHKETHTYIKRFRIERFLTNKVYDFIPQKSALKLFTTKKTGSIIVNYEPVPRIKKLQESFGIDAYMVKGISSKGVRLSTKKIKKVYLDKNVDM